jgi:cell division protein ZipA
MDIKDFILIGGGLLIAAVVAHGFWIAWRDRRQDLRIDIKPDLIPDDMDEMDRLRGELPNGGGRVVKPARSQPRQDQLDLAEPPPLLLEPTEGPIPRRRIEPDIREPVALPPTVSEVPERVAAEADPLESEPIVEQIDDSDYAQPSQPDEEPDRPAVAEVEMPPPLVAEEPTRRPRRLVQRRAEAKKPERAPEPAAVPVEELVVMNVLADVARPYTGDELFTALRGCGLKFGDMNIFHRVEPLTKAVQYSVASAIEPGTFDMADMESIRCPGLCLFMQLPGPEEPTAAFEDMLSVARSITKSLGGEVKDEHRNVMTPQTVEHYRQRILDFSRRRMSKRA